MGDHDVLKTQSLLYYVQGWMLAWTGYPAFEDPLEAPDPGPISCGVQRERNGNLEDDNLDDKVVKAVANAVIEAYGDIDAQALAAMIQEEFPWKAAIARAAADGSCGVEIRKEDLADWFTRLSLNGSGLRAPAAIVQDRGTTDSHVDVIGSQLALDWRQTLDWLADKQWNFGTYI